MSPQYETNETHPVEWQTRSLCPVVMSVSRTSSKHGSLSMQVVGLRSA